MTTEEPKKTVSIDLPPGMTAAAFQRAVIALSKQESKKRKKDSSRLFKVIEYGPDQEIRVTQETFKGKEYLSIRKWYSENGSAELKPGKGVTFNYEQIDDIMDGLLLMKEWCEEHPHGDTEKEEGKEDE